MSSVRCLSAESAKSTVKDSPSASEVRNELVAKAKVAPLVPVDSFRLALAQIELGFFPEAMTVAQLALGATKIPEERAAFLGVMAQCHGCHGDYISAAACALEGQRLNPKSVELAALRIAYFHELGDTANELAARDHYKRLVPDRDPDSKQVFFPVAVINGTKLAVAIYETVVALYMIYQIAEEQWPRIKPQIEVVKASWKKVAKQSIKLWPGFWPDYIPNAI